MKILFVFPGLANLGFHAYYKYPERVGSWYVPIGICYLAATAIQEGHEVDVLDLRYLSGFDEVEQKIASSDCHIVAITFQTPMAGNAYQCARIAKKHGKITVGGGIHPTVMTEEAVSQNVFDHLMVGEGCISFPRLVNDLTRGKGAEPVIMGEFLWKLDDIPFPHYFPLYVDTVIRPRKVVMMFTSRGCPGKCTFCQPVSDKLFGRRLIFRSAANIVSEVLHWRKLYNITRFMLVDDTFMVKKKLVHELCNSLINLNTGLEWTCNGRVNEFDGETVRLMAQSGCKWICIGFESGSQRMLDLTGKATTVEQGYRAAELCNQHGIPFTTNILAGIPGETKEDLALHFDFVRKIRAQTISYNWLVPYPGTEIYDYCEKNGLIDREAVWDNYDMHLVKDRGIIKGVDYELVRLWEQKTLNWREEIVPEAAKVLMEEATKLHLAHNKEEALKAGTRLMEDYPDEFYGYFLLGKFLKQWGEFQKAMEFLNKAIHILNKDPELYVLYHTSARFHLGELLYRDGKKKEAAEEFTLCLSLTPSHQKAQEYCDLLKKQNCS